MAIRLKLMGSDVRQRRSGCVENEGLSG